MRGSRIGCHRRGASVLTHPHEISSSVSLLRERTMCSEAALHRQVGAPLGGPLTRKDGCKEWPAWWHFSFYWGDGVRRFFRQGLLRFLVVALCLCFPWPATGPAEATGAQQVIAVVGDSMARGYCQGLKRKLKDLPQFTVTCWTKPSSGLTRDDFFDWNAELSRRLRSDRVSHAVVSMGANDAQALTLDNRIVKFAEPEWEAVYGARVADVMAQLGSMGVQTFWVGMPVARSSGYSSKMKRLNRIYAENAAQQGARFISLWEFSQNGTGSYARALPDASGRTRVARADDGIHFSRHGEVIVSCYILRQMAPSTGIPADALAC